MTGMESDLKRIIERHANQLVEEIKSHVLQEVRAALGDQAASTASVSSARLPPARPRDASMPDGKRRTAHELRADADRVVAYVAAHPRSRSEEIRAAVGLAQHAWIVTIRSLMDDKRVAFSGEKRSRIYWIR